MRLYKDNIEQPIIRDIHIEEDTPTEPVTLAEAKAWLKIDFDDEDALITALISQCRAGVEKFCNNSIVEKTITMIADWGTEWQLPYGPVREITSVHVKNNNAYDVQTLDTDYYVDGTLFKTLSGPVGRIKVVYVAGYETVPHDLKVDLLRIIAYCYEHRGDEALTSLQSGVDRPKGLDQALELFAKKHKVMLWV